MSTNEYVYPCDRGLPRNVQNRGWHNYVPGLGGVICCTYCGAKPAKKAASSPRSMQITLSNVGEMGPERVLSAMQTRHFDMWTGRSR